MAMSSIMSNLGGFMGCTSSSFTTRVCQRKGDTSEGPQSPLNTLPQNLPGGRTSWQSRAGDNLGPNACCHPDRAARLGVTGPGRPHQHSATKPSWDEQAQLAPSSARGAVAEPDRGGPKWGTPSCSPAMCLTPPSCVLPSLKARGSAAFCSKRSLVIWANS